MKKSTIGLACVCMYLLAASCQIPESVTLRGNPGVHLPLGSPFDLMDTRLEEFINFGQIKEMMGGGDDGVKIYEYTGPTVDSDVEAYVILYPITDMDLDLQEYIDSKTEDSDFTAKIPLSITNPDGNFPLNGYHIFRSANNTVEHEPVVNAATDDADPLFTIELPDMAKLVKEVTGGPFGLDLDYQDDFYDHLRISIPDLGIPNYIQGSDVTTDDGERKLRFVNNAPSAMLYPQRDFINGTISIYVIAMGPCDGTIEPKMVFEWETATVDASNNPIKDTLTIDNSALAGFFGGGIEFKEAWGYVYAGGIEDNAQMTLRIQGDPSTLTQGPLTEETRPSFSDKFNQPIPQDSLTQRIDLANVLNRSTASAITLEYDLSIDEMHIVNDDDKTKKIFADLVILLPMAFMANTSISHVNVQDAQNYAKLDLQGLFPKTGQEDLFQRTGSDDDLFSAIKTVNFVLSNLKNEILGGEVYIMVSAGAGVPNKLLNLQEKSPSAEFDISNVLPFAPQFDILLKKNTPNGALFWLKRKTSENAAFDFSLAIQAKTGINQTISIPGM